ncbi:phytase [Gammaproteobacteria bacterium]|nr:phytase [Gammaproteobacteria bacterium]
MKNMMSIIFILLFIATPVIAQTTSNVEDVEEVVVVGTLASLISAIEKQRKSNSIVSVVDSDALGDFPDTTAAEAIRRLSGISVENDQGEGRYVSIRGMSGDLNSIAVNGALIPAPEGGRKVMLDGLPTELLDSIEVYKSLTPDMDADAIGGRIEFNTKRASTLKKKLLKFKYDTSYNEQSKNSDNPKFALTYGNKINDTMGHILGITYASKQIVSYNNETGFPGWEVENGNAIQSEGCVYDDENRTLFISEEQDRGILRAYNIDDELDFSSPIVIDNRSGYINGDPEGVTIYKTSEKEGYVIVSSQGDDTFNLYDRLSPYKYIGSFKIGHFKEIDGVTDTDGISAINFNLNNDFKRGLFVAQDGTNDGKLKVKRQNFKLVSFDEILKSLDL